MHHTKKARVGDYVRKLTSREGHTVAAVFDDGSIMTMGSEAKWFRFGEYETLQRCDDHKHEADLARIANAEPSWANPGDPRVLACRRSLRARDFGATDARSLLSKNYNAEIRSLCERLASAAEAGVYACHRDLTTAVFNEISSSSRHSTFYGAVETLLASGLSLDEFLASKVSDAGGRVDLFAIVMSVMSKDIKDVLLREYLIDLDNPKTLTQTQGVPHVPPS